MQTSREKI